MFNKLFESFYLKVFVNIVIGKTNTNVLIETNNNKENIDSVEEVFDTIVLDENMQEFISSYTKETPFNYISILDTSAEQGVAPKCHPSNVSDFFDINSSNHLCYLNNWSFYTSKSNIKELKTRYEKVGVDFIFSPFAILVRFFKDKIDANLAMYILIEDCYISLSVFDNSQLLYADHIEMKSDTSNEDLLVDELATDDTDEEELDFDGSIDLDEIDVDAEMGELDDFGDIGDIEDLDNIDDMEDFSDEEESFIEEVEEEAPDLTKSEEEAFNEDYERFLKIQNSVNHFYKDDKYESVFIESAYIADGFDSGKDLKKYLEEEMFLSVIVRRIDLNAELCDLAKAELK